MEAQRVPMQQAVRFFSGNVVGFQHLVRLSEAAALSLVLMKWKHASRDFERCLQRSVLLTNFAVSQLRCCFSTIALAKSCGTDCAAL